MDRERIDGAGPDGDDDTLEPNRLADTAEISSDEMPESQEIAPQESQPRQPVLGDYVLLGRLGAGGMGRVFKARHRRMERLVALKVLPPSAMKDTGAVKRFHREVTAAAKLFHPNIVAAFDAGEQNGIHYLVMEYVDGHPLSKLIEMHGPLPAEKAADYIIQAGRGLEYSHSRGMVHRDVKPSNLMIDREGTVKILDMGTARFGDGSGTDLTKAGVIMGTVDYMSPEQARAPADIDQRTDIYSLGCTLYYLLIGRAMYAGDLIQTLLAHAQSPIPSIRDERPDVPEWMETIFRRMVAKLPEQRYETVAEVIADLEESGASNAPPDGSTAAAAGASSWMTGPAQVGPAQTGPAQADATQADPGQADPARIRSGASIRREPAVGIDFGTSFCTVAYLDQDGTPQTLLDSRGQAHTPSMLMIDGMNVLVGAKARKSLDRQPDKTAWDIKRSIGLPLHEKLLGENRYPPEALAGILLAKVLEEARSRIGDFRRAVISVPAHFDEVRRKSIQDAGYIAGLQTVDIMNEPLAAAVALGFAHDFLKPPGKSEQAVRMLVIDLGGGTLDATVMEVDESEFRELATDGDSRLGGRDWDERLVELVAERCVKTWGYDPRRNPGTRCRLALNCERAKILMSDHQLVSIDCRLDSGTGQIELRRAEFEQATVDLTERFGDVVCRAIEMAGLDWPRIDRVLLTGGATRMPMISLAVRRLAGRKLSVAQGGRDGVAQGAALFAGARRERAAGRTPAFRATTVNSRSLGVVGINRRSGRKHNAVLIPRNTPLPASSKSTFKTQRAGQESVVVHIVQGEEDEPDACTPIGRCVIENLPADLPAGSPVTVEFQYAANGRLTVFVESDATGYRATKEITRSSGLSNSGLSRWREWVETVILCSNFF